MKLFLTTILLIAFWNKEITVKSGTVYTQDMDNKTVLTKGKISVGSQIFKVIYYDNPTSRSLVEQMPFTVELEDYAGIEKIFYPKHSLSKKGAPKGADPSVGDIMYYTPWGDVAIFYKDFGYANGLIKLGEIEGDIEVLQEAGGMEATFELGD